MIVIVPGEGSPNAVKAEPHTETETEKKRGDDTGRQPSSGKRVDKIPNLK